MKPGGKRTWNKRSTPHHVINGCRSRISTLQQLVAALECEEYYDLVAQVEQSQSIAQFRYVVIIVVAGACRRNARGRKVSALHNDAVSKIERLRCHTRPG